MALSVGTFLACASISRGRVYTPQAKSQTLRCALTRDSDRCRCPGSARLDLNPYAYLDVDLMYGNVQTAGGGPALGCESNLRKATDFSQTRHTTVDGPTRDERARGGLARNAAFSLLGFVG